MQNIIIDSLIRSRRRTLSIEIAHDARLIVRAPLGMAIGDIQKFLLRKRSWVEKKQIIAAKRYDESGEKTFKDSKELYYLGEKYKILITREISRPVIFNDGFKIHGNYENSEREALIQWYKEASLNKITERLEFYSVLSGIRYKRCRISSSQRRWGSCGPDANLNFNYRLIMAPLDIIDYVVVHELVHIERRDHSRFFWSRVGEIFPEYLKSRQWLKERGHILNI